MVMRKAQRANVVLTVALSLATRSSYNSETYTVRRFTATHKDISAVFGTKTKSH